MFNSSYTIAGAVKDSGFSRSYLFRRMKDGSLPFKYCGRSRMVTGDDLQALYDSLQSGDPVEAAQKDVGDLKDRRA